VESGRLVQLGWNVPEGPVTIEDDSGATVHTAPNTVGLVSRPIHKTTTYTLKWPGGSREMTVELVP